jgi:hypothetical protein
VTDGALSITPLVLIFLRFGSPLQGVSPAQLLLLEQMVGRRLSWLQGLSVDPKSSRSICVLELLNHYRVLLVLYFCTNYTSELLYSPGVNMVKTTRWQPLNLADHRC